MKLTLEPTPEFFCTDEGIPVRAWTGSTEEGTLVIAFIAAICVPESASEEHHERFRRELVTIPGPNMTGVAVRGGH
jgi:hypothetical protein